MTEPVTYGPETSLRLVGRRDLIHDVAWSPVGNVLATGSGDESTRLWDPADGRLISVLPDAGPACRVAWSPDGGRIATSGHGARLAVHDVETARTLAAFEAPYLLVRGATWSPDGRRIATATGSDNVVLLSSETCGVDEVLHQRADDVAYSPDGEWLAVAGNVAKGSLTTGAIDD